MRGVGVTVAVDVGVGGVGVRVGDRDRDRDRDWRRHHDRDRIEIKKDGSVVGDLTTARISIEDGAYFKGSIEIDKTGDEVEKAGSKSRVTAGSTTS